MNERSQEEQSDIKKEEGAGFKQRFIGLAQYHKLTLREIEQCFKMYSLLQNEAPAEEFYVARSCSYTFNIETTL